jgi:hypothetical protein
MNEERTGKCLRQVEHICGHVWHRYSITVNKVMVATVKLSKWWVHLNHCWHVLFVWLKFPGSGLEVLKKTDLMWDTFKSAIYFKCFVYGFYTRDFFVLFLQTNKIVYYLSVLLMEIYFYFSNEAIVVMIVW